MTEPPVPSALQPTPRDPADPVLTFDAVYRDHARDVARWAARLGGEQEVEDLVQEVFLTVQRRLPQFRGEAPIGVWLFRITQKVLANHRRRRRMRRWLGMTSHMNETIASTEALPTDRLEQRQAAERLYSILDTLPEKYRQVLVLFELEDLSTQRIAELLGTKLVTVRVWLHRARAAFLKEQLRREGEIATSSTSSTSRKKSGS